MNAWHERFHFKTVDFLCIFQNRHIFCKQYKKNFSQLSNLSFDLTNKKTFEVTQKCLLTCSFDFLNTYFTSYKKFDQEEYIPANAIFFA